jgi:uncharacterized protein involved in response to NO
VGVSCPIYLGIQREVAANLPGPARVAFSASAVGGRVEFCWRNCSAIRINLLSSFLLLAAIVTAVYSLRLFEPGERAAKIKGVHRSFPMFVRLAYGWAIVSVGLAIWASLTAVSAGIWGASRHALTVGFIALMVFCVGQRVLPAFSGMRALFSTKLMFAALGLLFVGCFLRVGSEILAYQGFAGFAWSWLPVSAITELIAVVIFALNLAITFLTKRNRSELQYRNAT